MAEFAGRGMVRRSGEGGGKHLQVLIGEFVTVDRFSTPSIAASEVTTLDPIGFKVQR